MTSNNTLSNKRGLLALSPLAVFVAFYLVLSVIAGDFYKVPITVAFMVASIYAVAVTGQYELNKRIEIFSAGAGDKGLLLMLWIYVLAGAFASSAKAMGAVDATVNLTLSVLPPSMLLPGLFLAACFISLSIGTSVGTVVALVPITTGVAASTGGDIALYTAIVVGGAFFGDNLSFISDTTVAATTTQGCQMRDKFRVNLMIVVPAAVIILAIYTVMGLGINAPAQVGEVNWVKVVPYLVVLATAVAGLNVTIVLTLGVLLCGIAGMALGAYDLWQWLDAMGQGITGMGELIIIAMMAGGMLELIKKGGGIDYLIAKLTARVSGKRAAEYAIAALVGLVNMCTANNTVAILTVGSIARNIATQFGIDPRKTASILDTFSCGVQALLPYGAQMLLAAGLASLNPMAILPYLYYPMAMLTLAIIAIAVRYPRRYS